MGIAKLHLSSMGFATIGNSKPQFYFLLLFLQKISLIWGFLAISVQHEERLLHIVHFWGSYCPLSLRLPQKFCCQEIFMVASIGFIGTQILSRLQRVCKNELVLVCSSNGRSDGHWKKDSFVLSLKEKGIFQDLLSSEEESFPLRPFYGAIKAKWTVMAVKEPRVPQLYLEDCRGGALLLDQRDVTTYYFTFLRPIYEVMKSKEICLSYFYAAAANLIRGGSSVCGLGLRL